MNSIITPVSLGTRFLAIAYDILIAFFLSFIITLIIQTILIESGLIPLESIKISATQTISSIPSDSIVTTLLRSLWLIIPFLYFAYYWTKKGRTLGMKVWKIKAVSILHPDGTITWLQSTLRYFTALLGLGYLWILIDKENLPLQDRLSQTRLIKQN